MYRSLAAVWVADAIVSVQHKTPSPFFVERHKMTAFLSETETLLAILNHCRKAKTVKAAMALITQRGLRLIEDDVKELLNRGGEIQFLLGTDMATEPAAIESLLKTSREYANQMTVRRFATDLGQTFHPKVWIFAPGSGPGAAIVGSSNLTSGGLERNFEANVLIKTSALVGELEAVFDELFEGGRAKPIDSRWLDGYRDLWKELCAARKNLGHLQNKVKRLRALRTGKPTVPSRILAHSFAFTGGIEEWPRDAVLYPAIKQFGGSVVEIEGLKKAECLVHGDIRYGRKTTRKLRAARRAGIEIISQSDFFGILDNERRLRKQARRVSSTR